MNVHSESLNPKQRQILDAALALFSECGCAATPVPRIAEKAGVGVGTLYRYFTNKDALINAVFRDTKSRLAASIASNPHVFDPSAEPRARFSALWDGLVAFARAEPEAFYFLELQDHLPWLDPESRAFELAVLAPIHAACVDLQSAGVLRSSLSPEALIAMIWGALVGLIKAERHGYLTLDFTQLDAARDALWAGCVA